MPRSKIVCPGLERTGTTSLSQALNTLGYRSLEIEGHWYFVQRHKDVLSFVADHERASQYDAYADSPIPLIYQPLVDVFHNSVIIVTYRPLDAWLKSIHALHERLARWVFDPRDTEWKALLEAYNLQIHGARWFDRDLYAKSYEKHYSELDAFFRTRQEPVLKVDISKREGWSPICEFLQIPIPEESFPHRNATSSI